MHRNLQMSKSDQLVPWQITGREGTNGGNILADTSILLSEIAGFELQSELLLLTSLSASLAVNSGCIELPGVTPHCINTQCHSSIARVLRPCE